MNFTPFGGPFPGTIPGIPQFTATSAPLVTTITTNQDTSSNRYQNVTAVNMTHFNQPLPTTTTSVIPTAKFRAEDAPHTDKYNNGHLVSTGITQQQYTTYSQQTESDKRMSTVSTIAYAQNSLASSTAVGAVGGHVQQAPQELTQDLCNAILQQQDTKRPPWQTLTPGTTVADYLSHLPASTLPLSLHHFLKYSAETIKKENQNAIQTIAPIGIGAITIPQHQASTHLTQHQQGQHPTQQLAMGAGNSASTSAQTTTAPKKKKRKKHPKERKPKLRPGEIRLTTALDGSPLFMCPECQVAYPEQDLLEIHLVGHNLERRYICDICNAALKRKDHLTRHKQSHNPERPFICTVCLKAFKRKEQLSLHFVIHSGEKRHICIECGKGFYRKDHLRKHTRSHIARRVKAELSMQNQNGGTSMLQPNLSIQQQAQAAMQQHQQQQQQQQQQQAQAQQQQQQQTNQQQVQQQQQQQQHQMHQQQQQMQQQHHSQTQQNVAQQHQQQQQQTQQQQSQQNQLMN